MHQTSNATASAVTVPVDDGLGYVWTNGNRHIALTPDGVVLGTYGTARSAARAIRAGDTPKRSRHYRRAA